MKQPTVAYMVFAGLVAFLLVYCGWRFERYYDGKVSKTTPYTNGTTIRGVDIKPKSGDLRVIQFDGKFYVQHYIDYPDWQYFPWPFDTADEAKAHKDRLLRIRNGTDNKVP